MSEALAATEPAETTQTTQAAPPAEPAAAPPAQGTLLTDPATPAVPDKYEFAAPEGLEVDPEALGNFEAAAREVGLSQDQFAKVAGLGAQLIAQKVQAAVAAATPEYLQPAKQQEWQAAIKGDPEIGGDRLGPALAQAAKVIEQFGGAELRDALNLTRAGNNPAVVRAFVAIGKAMGDAEGLITGRPANARPVSIEQAARDVYNSAGGSYPPVTA